MKYLALLLLIFSAYLPGQGEKSPPSTLCIYRYAGSPAEIGAAFGQDEKDRFLNVYQKVLKENGIEAWQERILFLRIQTYAAYLDEETVQEMKSFAQAAQVPYSKVLLVNCFYDLVLNAGCRQVAAWGSKTDNGEMIHGRNLDWPDWGDVLRTSNVLLVRSYPEGNSIATVTWPGFLGCLTGCNDKGIAIAYNQITGPSSPIGEPVFLVLKRALRYANTLSMALKIIQESPLCTCGSILISSTKEKSAWVVKLKNRKVWVRKSGNDEFLVNNNTCYFSPEGNYALASYQASKTYKAMSDIGPLNVDRMKSVLADARILQWINIQSVIFRLERNEMHISCGKYMAAEGPYQTIELFKAESKGPKKNNDN